MSNGEIMQVLYMTIFTAIKLGGPLLLLSMLIGVTVSIFQAASQINEQTLTFVPKVVIILLVGLSASSWMMATSQDYFYAILELMNY